MQQSFQRLPNDLKRLFLLQLSAKSCYSWSLNVKMRYLAWERILKDRHRYSETIHHSYHNYIIRQERLPRHLTDGSLYILLITDLEQIPEVEEKWRDNTIIAKWRYYLNGNLEYEYIYQRCPGDYNVYGRHFRHDGTLSYCTLNYQYIEGTQFKLN
jgi:hypothetical protein